MSKETYLSGNTMVNSHLHVEIEATNLCNTRCIHCPRESLIRPTGKMDWHTYQIIMDKVTAYTPNFCVVYSGFGEPMLNPSIYDFIAYVSQKGRTSIITNAAALTPKNVQRLIEAGLAQITVSFNGTEKALYELMMGGLDFERAEKHLKNTVEMTKGTQTVVGANVSVTRQTQDHLATIKRDLESVGIEQIYLSKCHNRGGSLKGDWICTTPPPPMDEHHCELFMDIMFVSWTGEVLPCYHDLAGANVIGDLRVDPIETIQWRKKKIAEEGGMFDLCKGCNDLYRFCDDKTPDGRPLSDWVYDLYADGEPHIPAKASSLSKWLYALYIQEGRSDRFFEALINHIHLQDQKIEELQQETETLASEVYSVQSQNPSSTNSRSSQSRRLITRVQKIRHLLFPQDSSREKSY